MSDRRDHVTEDDAEYRRGLVLGLTMAEVMILVLFCLLLTALYLMNAKDRTIKALGGNPADRVFVVSAPNLKAMEQQFGPIDSQASLSDDFQRLLVSNAEIENAVQSSQLQFAEKPRQEKVRDLAKISKGAYRLLKSNGVVSKSSDDVARGIESLASERSALDKAKRIAGASGNQARDEIRAEVAGILCASQYNIPQQRTECEKKILSIAGGKGLELQSCWWDKTTTPWKTKDIFDVAVTDDGFIIRDLDPGIAEYRQQKAELPTSRIQAGKEISEADFLSQTSDLSAWSDKNKCRFFVRLFDRTGSNAKATYQARISAVEKRFYKERTQRDFVEAN
jgi:hypothetical protein